MCIHPVAHEQEVCRVRIPEVALVGCRVYKSSALLGNSKTSFCQLKTTHPSAICNSFSCFTSSPTFDLVGVLYRFRANVLNLHFLKYHEFGHLFISSLPILNSFSCSNRFLMGSSVFILLVFCNAVQILMLIRYLCIL